MQPVGSADGLHGDKHRVKNNSTILAWVTGWIVMQSTQADNTGGAAGLR